MKIKIRSKPGGALLAVVLVGVGFWILSKRREQRREGWS